MILKKLITSCVVCLMLLTTSGLFAAEIDFNNIHSIFNQPEGLAKVLPYAINLASYPGPVKENSIRHKELYADQLMYLAKVNINNKLYFRLVLGNYSNQKQARKQLDRVRNAYPGAWVNVRSEQERQMLSSRLFDGENRISPRIKIKSVAVLRKPEKLNFPEKLLEQAKQEFFNHNFSRVLAITEKVIETGTDLQKQQAMELSGVVRERQRQFAQAIAIYTEFLTLYPDSILSTKIKNRLTGLKTMRLEPKDRIAKSKRKSDRENWTVYGALSQYYRDDVVDRENDTSEEVNSALVTDVNVFARRKTQKNALVLRFDGGLINDFLDDETNSRISRAMVSYTDNDSGYQVTGGRQSRTAKGVFGRFDGFVYKGLSHSDFNYSIFTGYPVQSSSDDLETSRHFIGSSVNFKPLNKVDMDVYLLHQEVSGLIDRQVLGAEFQYRTDQGFMYGIIDYDLFYSDLNNITAIANYRIDDSWAINITYDNRYSPLLTTTNALQGQAVASIKELNEIFTKKEIYQLAEDRISKSQNLFVGSSHQLDADRQLYLSLSFSSIEKTVASGGVSAIPASDDIQIAGDYTIRGYFFNDDYTTFGLRLSDTASAQIVSLRSRTRFRGSSNLRYDPRLRLDYRQSKDSDVTQWILRPSFKMTYKPTKKISFEASIGIEYSNFDLPELEDQTTYNLFIGYVYQF